MCRKMMRPVLAPASSGGDDEVLLAQGEELAAHHAARGRSRPSSEMMTVMAK
jgi:hypothetical protein